MLDDTLHAAAPAATDRATPLLEQYKLYVEMADRISQRRASANTFLLTVNTTLVTVYGLVNKAGDLPPGRNAWSIIVPLCGAAVSLLWFAIITSYRNLNSLKFQVVAELEKHLPSQPYTAEWHRAGQGRWGRNYWPLTHVERALPLVFLGFYLALAIVR